MARRKIQRPLKSVTQAVRENEDNDDDALIGAKKARELLGNCSEMHIWRLLNLKDYAALKFPKPIKINTRNYWKRCDIRNWIERQAALSGRAA
jgi:predicted DNA-binding transcriptional regulator AlpA